MTLLVRTPEANYAAAGQEVDSRWKPMVDPPAYTCIIYGDSTVSTQAPSNCAPGAQLLCIAIADRALHLHHICHMSTSIA